MLTRPVARAPDAALDHEDRVVVGEDIVVVSAHGRYSAVPAPADTRDSRR